MAFLKWTALCLTVLSVSACAFAQQHFPLRSGEWTSTTPDPTGVNKAPMTMLFCMNDELWTKAISQNPSCTISNLSLNAGGGSYSLDCPMKTMQMKGTIKMTFDGMTHLISNASFDMTFNGKSNHMESSSDFRWKGPTCDPTADMNLRNHSVPPPH